MTRAEFEHALISTKEGSSAWNTVDGAAADALSKATMLTAFSNNNYGRIGLLLIPRRGEQYKVLRNVFLVFEEKSWRLSAGSNNARQQQFTRRSEMQGGPILSLILEILLICFQVLLVLLG